MVWVISWKLGWMQIYDTEEYSTQAEAAAACEAARVKHPDCTDFVVEEAESLDAIVLGRILERKKR